MKKWRVIEAGGDLVSPVCEVDGCEEWGVIAVLDPKTGEVQQMCEEHSGYNEAVPIDDHFATSKEEKE